MTSDQRVPRPDVVGSDVAAAEGGPLADVSTAAVSRVLNNIPCQVSRATRCSVLQVIHDLNSVPNALAQSLHQRRTQTVDSILPDIPTSYDAEITQGIAAVARKSGRTLTWWSI